MSRGATFARLLALGTVLRPRTRRCPTAPGDHAIECLGVPPYSSLGHSQFLSCKVCQLRDYLSSLYSVQFVLLAHSDALHVPRPTVRDRSVCRNDWVGAR